MICKPQAGADPENSERRGRRNCGESAPPPPLKGKVHVHGDAAYSILRAFLTKSLTSENDLQNEILTVVLGGLFTGSSCSIHTSYEDNWK